MRRSAQLTRRQVKYAVSGLDRYQIVFCAERAYDTPCPNFMSLKFSAIEITLTRRVARVHGTFPLDMVEEVWTDASVAHSTLRERVPAGTALPADGSDGCHLSGPYGLCLVDDGRARRSMARPTTNDNITVNDDDVFWLLRQRDAVPPSSQALPVAVNLECSVVALRSDMH